MRAFKRFNGLLTDAYDIFCYLSQSEFGLVGQRPALDSICFAVSVSVGSPTELLPHRNWPFRQFDSLWADCCSGRW